jgi:hypothetical protein
VPGWVIREMPTPSPSRAGIALAFGAGYRAGFWLCGEVMGLAAIAAALTLGPPRRSP